MRSTDTGFPAAIPPPACAGMALREVDTPALLLDLDAFERNLARLPRSLAGSTVRVRPHAKSHKCPEIARHQIAHGAIGVCCQKVSEAEALVRGGVADVLVTNEIVGAPKLARLAALAGAARLGACVDAPAHVADLGAAVQRAGTKLDVYVEVNVGGNRCGVDPGEPAVALARDIANRPGLHFAGLHAYHGPAQHLRTPEQRAVAIGQAVDRVQQTLSALERAGLPAGIVTGAGTGTYQLEAASRVYNEIQPGSYIFMDADYGRNLGDDAKPVHEYEQSLFILATVMSHVTPQRAVVDAGLKAHSVDAGLPLVHGLPGIDYVKAADEHGVLALSGGATLELGQKIRLIPGHCDPTVNLYDWLVCYRGNRVEALWPITARGAVY